MAWINFSRLLRFGINSRKGNIAGQPAVLEIDGFTIGKKQQTYYKPYTCFVKLQERAFVVRSAIGKLSKLLSSADFIDENEESELLDKINSPNNDQTKEEFLKEFAIFLLSAGWTGIYKKWESFGNFETLQLINLNPDETEIQGDYVITVIDEKETKLLKEDVILFFDTVRKCDRGYSRLTPLRTQVENTITAQLAKGIQIENSGTTIVSPKAANQQNNVDEGLDKLVPEKKGNLRTQGEEMEDRLNNRGIENRIIVASKGLDATNLSEKLNSVNFHEIVEEDMLAIYDAYGIQIELTPFGKTSTYDNKEQAEADLVEEEIIPLATNLIGSLNKEFKRYGNLMVSFDHMSSVANTKSKRHETNTKIIDNYSKLLEQGVITLDRYNEILIQNQVL